MSIIQHAINNLKHHIPKEVLEYAFNRTTNTFPTMKWGADTRSRSIDSVIRAEIIEGRVNEDCNLVGGTEHVVHLNKVPRERVDDLRVIYRIPYDMTLGRKIISCQSVSYTDYHLAMDHSGNQLASATLDLFRAGSAMPIIETAHVEVMADNIVMVTDEGYMVDRHFILQCTLENDASLSNMPKGAYKHYAKLVELATKAYIHNKTTVHLDQGALHYGQSLGRLKEIIDDYRDANEQYREYFDQYWGKVAFFSDRTRVNKFVQSQIGRWF